HSDFEQEFQNQYGGDEDDDYNDDGLDDTRKDHDDPFAFNADAIERMFGSAKLAEVTADHVSIQGGVRRMMFRRRGDSSSEEEEEEEEGEKDESGSEAALEKLNDGTKATEGVTTWERTTRESSVPSDNLRRSTKPESVQATRSNRPGRPIGSE